MAEKNVQNDFSKGNIPAVVMRMALPLIAAQLVNVLYNVVDRIYIGHIPNVGSMALTGVGIALPVISILSAFAGLFGQGGAPLCDLTLQRVSTCILGGGAAVGFGGGLLQCRALAGLGLPVGF